MKTPFLSLRSFFHPKPEEIPFHPKNLTEHYKNDLAECFFDAVYIATEYTHINKLLEGYKYHSHREVGKKFIPLFSQLLSHFDLSQDESTYIPMPMHWSRYLSRGFDHIAFLLRRIPELPRAQISHLLGVKIFSLAFRQSHLSREKRLANKYNTFTIKSHSKIPEEVIVFDDIISTGSTLNECAKILKNAGVKKVIGVFLASNVS